MEERRARAGGSGGGGPSPPRAGRPRSRPGRARKALRLLLALLLLGAQGAVLGSAAGRAAAATFDRDPWYRDVPVAHWAYGMIRALWEAGVTDGDRWTVGGRVLAAYFRPDATMSRAEYALLSAQSFKLAPVEGATAYYADVGPELLLYGRLPALPWVEALRRQGWVGGAPGSLFHPEAGLRRDMAVAFLISGLGFDRWAEALPVARQMELLGRFPDGGEALPEFRARVALAVQLGILEGYPDGSLQPARLLTRAEAAAEIYRSAMITLRPSPNPFSPDGDGWEDETTIGIGSLLTQPAYNWNLFIRDLSGRELFRFRRGSQPMPLPESVTWEGSDALGLPVPDGEYRLQGAVVDRQGNELLSVPTPLFVVRRRLEALLEPERSLPGATVAVLARTTGGARSVSAALAGQVRALAPAGESDGWTTWSGLLAAPADEGAYAVTVRADFGPVAREQTLTLRVERPLHLEGSLDPNPAPRGFHVRLRAEGSSALVAVEAVWPDGSRQRLLPLGAGAWQGDWRIPDEWPDGAYPVELTGRTADGRSAGARVDLVVGGELLEMVRFVLTG
ncbi:MAG: S-layer homology domain-containing protein [Firmicutes bacterium]|nr:S-layer homology domain-containing protein [Bacillota bacterium]